MNYQEARDALVAAGVLNYNSLGYFGTDPLSAMWASSRNQPGMVLNQQFAAGSSIAVNTPLVLMVSEFPISVAEQTGFTPNGGAYVLDSNANVVLDSSGNPVEW